VYLGNVPDPEANSTYCPHDGALVIERKGYQTSTPSGTPGRCGCGAAIPGVFL
jgi:pyruvate formate lyase activating enzyme